jgi:hypothetical protein
MQKSVKTLFNGFDRWLFFEIIIIFENIVAT